MRTRILRTGATVLLALALIGGSALPAFAAPTSVHDTAGLTAHWADLLRAWLAWSQPPRHLTGGDNTAPNLDPNGVAVAPTDGNTAPDLDPNGNHLEDDGDGNTAPNLDPDG